MVVLYPQGKIKKLGWLFPKWREKFAKNARKTSVYVTQTLETWRNKTQSDEVKWSDLEQLNFWKKVFPEKYIKIENIYWSKKKPNQADNDSTSRVSWAVKEKQFDLEMPKLKRDETPVMLMKEFSYFLLFHKTQLG